MAWLDWLRAGAAFVVLFNHTRQASFVAYGALPPEQQNIATALFMFVGRAGQEAVTIFFVISGFLVGGAALSRAWKGEFRWRSYMLDRLVRIATPLLPAVLLTLMVGYMSAGRSDFMIAAANLVGLQGVLVKSLFPNSPLWSLSYEMWFYVLGGAIAVLLMRFNVVAALLLLFSLLIFTRLDPLYVIVWMMGAAASFYRPRWLRAELVASLVLMSAGLVLSQLTRDSKAIETLPINFATALLTLSVGASWVVACLSRLSSPKRLATIGAALAAPSYTLYLTHAPILHFWSRFRGFSPQPMNAVGWAAFAELIAVSLCVAFMFYLAFERNTQLFRSWANRRLTRS